MKSRTYGADEKLNSLWGLIETVLAKADEMAIVILAEDLRIVEEKPALKKIGFLERSDSDAELNRVLHIFHEHGIACRVVFGISDFMEKALKGRLFPKGVRTKVVLDRTEGGGHRDGFGPARRSTGALLCQQFGFFYGHGDAYSAAITRHKHHQSLVLRAAGIGAPKTWSFDARRGWVTGKPPLGTKVICKSTFEAWSIGVSEDTTGYFNSDTEYSVRLLAEEIGQPVCVQEFITGPEIYALILDVEEPFCVGMAEAWSSLGPKSNGSYLVFEDHCRAGGIVYGKVRGLSPRTRQDIRDSATAAFSLLSMSGYGRIDFRLDEAKNPYVIDIADNPGTSKASSLAFILLEEGFTYSEIPLLLLATSLQRSPKFGPKLA